MKITRKTQKKIGICSTVIAVAFLIISIVLYGASPSFDYLLIAAFTVGVSPIAIAGIFHSRWKQRILNAMPDFLRDLGTSTQTGVPIQIAMEHASQRNYGPLTDELKVLVTHMSWGMNFEEAMSELSERVDLDLVTKAVTLVLEATKHGGDLNEIFYSTAAYMDNVNTWETRRRTQTMPYIGIFYFSVIVFLFIIIMISQLIFVPLGELADTPLLNPVLTTMEARRLFLHAAILEAFFGGMLAGKINEASFIAGLKHSMVLAVISGVAFFVFFP